VPGKPMNWWNRSVTVHANRIQSKNRAGYLYARTLLYSSGLTVHIPKSD
jgi:hypothetical protein